MPANHTPRLDAGLQQNATGRRTFLRTALIATPLAWTFPALLAGQSPPASSQQADKTESKPAAPVQPLLLKPAADDSRQVRLLIEVSGQLRVNPDGKQVMHVPMQVNSDQNFVERRLPNTKDGVARLVRQYRDAKAEITLKESKLSNSLREDRRLIVVDASVDEADIFSAQGPLLREELDLVDVPGAALPLNRLLPLAPVKPGDTWKLPREVATLLVRLDVVHEQDLTLEFQEVRGDKAILSLSGKVSGAIGGVSSDLEMKGKVNFDLTQKHVTWLALAVRETRAVGHAQPGFEAVSQIRLVSAPIPAPPELSDKIVGDLPAPGSKGPNMLELRNEKGGFEIVHDRRWSVLSEKYDSLVLRFVDRGDLIAQCNLARLPKLPKGEELTLAGFESDARKNLEKVNGQIVEASEGETAAGLRMLRVVVHGQTNKLPIQWSYHHLSDATGNRVSLAIAIEGKLLETYPAVDREFVGGLRFVEPSAESAPAAPTRAAAVPTASGNPSR